MGLPANKTREWYAVGVDRHGSPDFFCSTDPDRFEGSLSIAEAAQRFRSPNDFSNLTLIRTFSHFDCDLVFASDLSSVKEFVRDECCRVLIMHCGIQEMGDTTELLLKRQDILQVLLYSTAKYGDKRIDFEADLGFQELEDSRSVTPSTNIFTPSLNSSGELSEPFVAVVKPYSLMTFVEFLLARIEG